MIGWQQGFDPALLTVLVLGSKLVRPQARLAPHQREGELLFGLAQLDGAALQNNHPCQVPVGRPFLVEEEVPLEHTPALLIGSLYLTLWYSCAICGLLTQLQIDHLLNFITQHALWNNGFHDITGSSTKKEVMFFISVFCELWDPKHWAQQDHVQAIYSMKECNSAQVLYLSTILMYFHFLHFGGKQYVYYYYIYSFTLAAR